jgi:exportin-T
MVQQWCGVSQDTLKGFDKFVYERIIPVIFSIPMLDQIDLEDATTVLLIKELSKLLRLIYLQIGGDVLIFLRNQILSKLNDQEIQNFLMLVQSDNSKAFDVCFLNLMKHLNKN